MQLLHRWIKGADAWKHECIAVFQILGMLNCNQRLIHPFKAGLNGVKVTHAVIDQTDPLDRSRDGLE